MAFEQRPGQGSLFRNAPKKSDKAPDYSGSINIDGTVTKLVGWVKESAGGKKFLSIAVDKPKQQAEPEAAPF